MIFDRRLRAPAASRIFSTLERGPVIIFCTREAANRQPADVARLSARGATVERVDVCESAAFLRASLTKLAALGCNTVLVEGGPTLHHAFWSARMADRLQLFITPRTAGERGVRWDVVPLGTVGALQARRIHPVGTDMLIEGYVHGTD